MIEVIVLGIIAIIFLMLFVIVNSKDNLFAKERKINSLKERLHLAENKFMKGRIKNEVFISLKEDLEKEIIDNEMSLLRLEKSMDVNVESKTKELLERIEKPTEKKRVRISNFLKETELIRREMAMLEKKFLKKEIGEKTFKEVMKKKENELIEKETEIIHLVKK